MKYRSFNFGNKRKSNFMTRYFLGLLTLVTLLTTSCGTTRGVFHGTGMVLEGMAVDAREIGNWIKQLQLENSLTHFLNSCVCFLKFLSKVQIASAKALLPAVCASGLEHPDSAKEATNIIITKFFNKPKTSQSSICGFIN